MTISDFLTFVKNQTESSLSLFDIELLLAFRLGKSRSFVRAFEDNKISDNVLAQLKKDIQKLVDGYPLAYLLGEKDFWDMTLKVTEDTLIPRSDTETLIEVAIQLLPANFSGKLMDLGTGSGAIAIAMSRVFPKANIWASDFSEKALAVAQENAQNWQKTPITFLRSDWLTALDNTVIPAFYVIVSNPPYIEENDCHLHDLKYEPINALTAPDNGLADIKTIITQAPKYLQNDGILMLEHGYDQGQAVRNLLSKTDWYNMKTYQDLGGNDRVTIAQKKKY